MTRSTSMPVALDPIKGTSGPADVGPLGRQESSQPDQYQPVWLQVPPARPSAPSMRRLAASS
jgi:hypothetical protein